MGAALCCAASLFFVACHQQPSSSGETIDDRSQTPILEVDSVTTLVSDSGIVRYRISAREWRIYDKAEPTYWEFPEGIYLEKFNETLDVEASLKADYAKYLDQSELWELKGQVHALNEKGEQFLTEQLFWNQKTEQVYSDSAITITRESSIIQGVGFLSNQTLTQYTITNPTGYFPIEE